MLPARENQHVEFKLESVSTADSAEELVRLFQASGLFHYDTVELSTAVIEQLNLFELAAYFRQYELAFEREPESEKHRLLRASDVLGPNDHPTVGGLLVFGISPERTLPQSGIQFAHFAGTAIDADLIDKREFGGSLPRQIDNAFAALRSNLSTLSTLQGPKRLDAPGYPDQVLRELIVNACVHRNYSITGSQIRILLFANRCEFISPGRLPNTVTIEKLAVGTSFARNPLLVRLMESQGYMDRLGRGLPMVVREAARLGHRVHFEESGEEFRVTLPLNTPSTPDHSS